MAERGFVVTGTDRSDYMVTDMARALAFYRDVLGMEPTTSEGHNAEYVLADGTAFGLWQGEMIGVPFQPSNGVLLAVDDLAAAVAALKARDVPIFMELETPVCTMVLIHDSEGNIVNLHQRKTP